MKIKMRTWLDGQFFYWGHIEPGTFAGPVSSSGESLSIDEMMERTQMFTGLKDKNGKEIYEGDVVKYSPLGEEEKMVWKVRFDQAQFYLYNEHPSPRNSDFTDTATAILGAADLFCEIIGNIYENPELLEEIANA